MGRIDDLKTVGKAQEAALPPPGVAAAGKTQLYMKDMKIIPSLDNSLLKCDKFDKEARLTDTPVPPFLLGVKGRVKGHLLLSCRLIVYMKLYRINVRTLVRTS